MGSLLTSKQRRELLEAHRVEKYQRFADRIKAILLLDSNWQVADIAEALLIDPDTVRNYKQLYESKGIEGLCSFAYDGRECQLSAQEIKQLTKQLRSKIYICTTAIITFIKKTFKVNYSTSGVTALLHRIGFSYKKPTLVPGKASPEQQEQFLGLLEDIKNSKNPTDKLYYGDGTHPQHNSVASHGWLPRGEETKLKSNTGRQRVNISGVLDAETHEVIVCEHQRLNAETTIDFLKLIERRNPKSKRIFIILDNAGYHKGKKISDFLKTSKIKIIFLPPYAPNLNLIERLWKYFKKQVLYNQYYPTFKEFKIACMQFFQKKNLRKHRKELKSLLTENFQIVSA
jgi:transposase